MELILQGQSGVYNYSDEIIIHGANTAKHNQVARSSSEMHAMHVQMCVAQNVQWHLHPGCVLKENILSWKIRHLVVCVQLKNGVDLPHA